MPTNLKKATFLTSIDAWEYTNPADYKLFFKALMIEQIDVEPNLEVTLLGTENDIMDYASDFEIPIQDITDF